MPPSIVTGSLRCQVPGQCHAIIVALVLHSVANRGISPLTAPPSVRFVPVRHIRPVVPVPTMIRIAKLQLCTTVGRQMCRHTTDTRNVLLCSVLVPILCRSSRALMLNSACPIRTASRLSGFTSIKPKCQSIFKASRLARLPSSVLWRLVKSILTLCLSERILIMHACMPNKNSWARKSHARHRPRTSTMIHCPMYLQTLLHRICRLAGVSDRLLTASRPSKAEPRSSALRTALSEIDHGSPCFVSVRLLCKLRARLCLDCPISIRFTHNLPGLKNPSKTMLPAELLILRCIFSLFQCLSSRVLIGIFCGRLHRGLHGSQCQSIPHAPFI
jgi:hypothetical protein